MNYKIAGLIGLLFYCCPVASSDQQELQVRERYFRAKKDYEELLTRYNALEKQLAQQERAVLPSIVQGRLTSITAVAVPQADVSASSTIYFTPYNGNQISLYWEGGWRLYDFAELTLTVSGSADKNYDIFAYNAGGGVVTLALGTAWTSDTARAVALSLQDGVLVLSTDVTRRYLGTVRTSAPNKYDHTSVFKGLWNYYNRVPLVASVIDGSNSWQYNKTTWRQSGNNAANAVSMVIGIDEVLVRAFFKSVTISSAAAARAATTGIGVDTDATNSALLMGARGNGSGTTEVPLWAEYAGYPGIGFHTFYSIEVVPASANVTFWGDNNQPNPVAAALITQFDG